MPVTQLRCFAVKFRSGSQFSYIPQGTIEIILRDDFVPVRYMTMCDGHMAEPIQESHLLVLQGRLAAHCTVWNVYVIYVWKSCHSSIATSYCAF